MKIDDVNAMDDADMRENEINKLAEKVYFEHENNDLLYGESLELRLAYKAGVVDGYNKAKEMEKQREKSIFSIAYRMMPTEYGKEHCEAEFEKFIQSNL